MDKTKILIVSYLFPPSGGISVQRALSLAKYLPRHGFEVHILAARNAATPIRDEALVGQVPKEVQVHSAFTPEFPFIFRHLLWRWLSGGKRIAGATEPGSSQKPAKGLKSAARRLIRRVMCPEPEVLWVPFALRQAERIVLRYNIDVVMVTAPPFSAFLIGNELKRRHPRIKLIADFRDEWLSFYLKDFDFQNDAHTRKRAEQIEQETVQLSDLVVAVTESSLRTIQRRYPKERSSKFQCIMNGYDPEHFGAFTPRPHGTGKCIVTHLGTVYKTASPKYYLDAVEHLETELQSRIETRFVGRVANEEQATLDATSAHIRVLGFLPQSEALRWAEETDFLLLTMTNDISLPGKLFEYLATGKPVLALSPEHGEVKRILDSTGAGWCVDPHDRVGIQKMLERALQLALEDRFGIQRWGNGIGRYARPNLVDDYARKIKQILLAKSES